MKTQVSVALKMHNVSKEYTLHHAHPTIIGRFKHLRGVRESFSALDNINVTIKQGERVGIIGLNGSGKTTLLKIIAGITTPSGGTIEKHGTIAAFMDVSAGFNLDLTGFENIYLNGMLLGIRKRIIDKQLTKIIKFAGLAQFIDLPLYTYSQGMRLRLGFAIAVHAKPDILIMDENVSVGDISFQQIAYRKTLQLLSTGITVLVVTQHLEFLSANCNRILVLDRGKIIKDGSTQLLLWYQKHYGNTQGSSVTG